jgi:hypothetical protein
MEKEIIIKDKLASPAVSLSSINYQYWKNIYFSSSSKSLPFPNILPILECPSPNMSPQLPSNKKKFLLSQYVSCIGMRLLDNCKSISKNA